LIKLIQIEVKSAIELRAWLTENFASDQSFWLVTYKKIKPDFYVSTSEILDELVAFGWTDGTKQFLDETRTMQLICKRKTKVWAKSYKDRAEKLILEGRMHPHGLLSVEDAKRTGSWTAMNEVDSLVIPKDLEAALSAFENSTEYFAKFPASIKRNTLRWIASAKTAETRAKRIRITADSASHNVRVATNSAPKNGEAKSS
jgi:uncharacterized protein YdeI (YjbR/CyaY-like superfamily)